MYTIIRSINRNRPDILYKSYKSEKFRRKCYDKFEKGEKFITKSYGKMEVVYEAISPKNYWHLAMGSQQEDKFMERVFETITEGNVILDIGAHVGMYAVPFAKKTGRNGKVYAFEPESKGFEAIKRNAILNSLKNIIPLNIAVSDREGDINFYVRPDKDTHSIFEKSLAPSPLGIQENIKVKTMTVDHMIEAGVVLEPDFIKIDVEGAELKVLDGIGNTQKRIRHILVEIHESALSLEGIQNPKEEVELRLQMLGFTKLEYLDSIHVLASR